MWGKEIRSSTYKRDNFGLSVIVRYENCVKIDIIMAKILLINKSDLDLHNQG